MVRRLPSAARRERTSMSSPRFLPTTSPKTSLRSRFRRVAPIVTRRRGGSGSSVGGGETASGIRVVVDISTDTVSRMIAAGNHISGAEMDRWAAIAAGNLPEDDDFPRPMDPEQIDETERDRLDEIQAWGRAREEVIREETNSELAMMDARAEELESTSGPTRSSALRQAARLRSQMEDLMDEARGQMAAVAEQVREAREEARSELAAEVQRAEEALAEHLAELKAGLNAEITAAVCRYFSYDVDVNEYEIV